MTIINLHIIWLTEKNSLLHGVWQYWGRTMLSSSSATWQQLFGQDKHRWAFVGYLVNLFFKRQQFWADDFQIPQHRQALFVMGNLK